VQPRTPTSRQRSGQARVQAAAQRQSPAAGGQPPCLGRQRQAHVPPPGRPTGRQRARSPS
jgi:hypothetical protein